MTKKIKLKISARLLKRRFRKKKSFGSRKPCRFCGSRDQETLLDYKNSTLLKYFMTERGKILPSRISGVCCAHQRKLSDLIKKARTIALLPYSAS